MRNAAKQQFHHFDQVSDAPGLRSSPVSIVPAWYFADRKCCAGRKPPWEGNVKNSRTSQVNELDLFFFNGCLIAGLKFKSLEMNKYWHIPHVTLHSEFNHLHIKSYLPRPSIALEASLMPVSLRTNWSCQRFCTGKMRGMRTWRSCAQHRTIQIPCHGLVSSNVSVYYLNLSIRYSCITVTLTVLMRISMSMYVHSFIIFLILYQSPPEMVSEKFGKMQCLEVVCIDSLLEDLGAKYGKMRPEHFAYKNCLRDETRRKKSKRKQEDTKVLNHGCQLQWSSEKCIKQFCGDPAAAASSFSRMLPECQCVFGCDHGKVWTESLSIVGTQQSSSMFANHPTQESWCEGHRSDQRLHLNAIFSCLVETTTFRVAHTTPKDVWSLFF